MSKFPLRVDAPTDRPAALLKILHLRCNMAAFRPLRKTTILGIPQILLPSTGPQFRRTT